jgi:hypothetical protein
MTAGGTSMHVRRVLADFALALALIWGVILWSGAHDGSAHAVPLQKLAVPHGTMTVEGASAVFAMPPALGSVEAFSARQPSQILLSIAVAALAALNLAFWRHLRRVYASPRRSVWRRGA